MTTVMLSIGRLVFCTCACNVRVKVYISQYDRLHSPHYEKMLFTVHYIYLLHELSLKYLYYRFKSTSHSETLNL